MANVVAPPKWKMGTLDTIRSSNKLHSNIRTKMRQGQLTDPLPSFHDQESFRYRKKFILGLFCLLSWFRHLNRSGFLALFHSAKKSEVSNAKVQVQRLFCDYTDDSNLSGPRRS